MKKFLCLLLIATTLFITSSSVTVSLAEEVSSIETTNVAYDLRVLYGGDDYLNFNPQTLYPNENKDKIIDFKFLCAKPLGSSLYLYLYHYEVNNADIQSANFSISFSKVQNSTGNFEEDFSVYTARYINSSGYQSRFIKFCIDNVLNVNDDTRFYIRDCVIDYKVNGRYFQTPLYTVGDEMHLSPTESEDFVYEYFKDDYVRITDGEVNLLLVQNTRDGVISDLPTSYNEDFYYFFNTDKKIEELIEIQYDYTLVDYEADMLWAEKSHSRATDDGVCYAGLLSGINNNNSIFQRDALDVRIIKSEPYYNNTIKMGYKTVAVERPFFLWANQKIVYTVNNIQNTKDLSNLEGDENKPFKDFIVEVQEKRESNGKEQYSWCFKVHSSLRESIDWWTKQPWYYIFAGSPVPYDFYSTSSCHEVKQTMITWLHFRTNEQEFMLNALDVPKDTTGLYVENVPFETFSDLTFRYFRNIIDSLSNGNVTKVLSAFFGVIVIIFILWLILKFVEITRKNTPKKGAEIKNKRRNK